MGLNKDKKDKSKINDFLQDNTEKEENNQDKPYPLKEKSYNVRHLIEMINNKDDETNEK